VCSLPWYSIQLLTVVYACACGGIHFWFTAGLTISDTYIYRHFFFPNALTHVVCVRNIYDTREFICFTVLSTELHGLHVVFDFITIVVRRKVCTRLYHNNARLGRLNKMSILFFYAFFLFCLERLNNW